MTQINVTAVDWYTLAPGLCVAAAGLVAVAADLGLKGRNRLVLSLISMAGLGAAIAMLFNRVSSAVAPVKGFGDTMVLDDLAAFTGLAIAIASALMILISPLDLERRKTSYGEFYGLMMLSTAGMIFLVQSNDFITLFLNLEIVSLALYVLTGLTRRNPRSNEAAVKYLVTGAFSTGFLLMGMAFVYGATASIHLEEIGARIAAGVDSPLLGMGFGLIICGFAFKIGAAPFHMWVPDVYEGAPTTTTAFMSVTVKAAGIASLIRVLLTAAPTEPQLWSDLLWGLAALTMVVGNLLALRQDSVKRMLAYSSVAHTGYALVALATMRAAYGTFSTQGASAALFYVFVYTFMTLGAFVLLVYVGHEVRAGDKVEWQDAEHIDDLAGLGQRHPWAAFAMTVFMVSLGGLPPTAGFLGKFWLFKAAVDQGHYGLAILGVTASLVSLYYYLRVVVVMYMRDPVFEDDKPDWSVGVVVAVAAALTLFLGLMPSGLLEIANRSISLLP